jgi:hypothetical protein
MAHHIAAAPPAAPEIFTAATWDHGVEQAIELVDAVACLETVRGETRDRLSDAVWDLDCGALRQTLARHGRGPLRWLSARWRQADRTIKSVLRNPVAPPLTEVLGDEWQLPPTRFFARMTGGQADEDDTETAQLADVESILGLFLARGAPQRTLRWHYRSEHHSLIAVSNREFYDSKLCIIPSPFTNESGRGIRFHHVPEGIYDSGNTRTNSLEAKRVAEAVMEHARLHPGQTLGVGTFSVAQRRAILDQLELLRRAQPQVESFFSSHLHELFFVKNLENIQGDERDVIFISVGYGRNAAGQMSMQFGPLSSQGGERRLVTFSEIPPGDGSHVNLTSRILSHPGCGSSPPAAGVVHGYYTGAASTRLLVSEMASRRSASSAAWSG